MMKPRTVYTLLGLLGIVLPYSQFLPFLREHGLDLRLFFAQVFSNRVSAFFGWDVVVSTLVLWAFVFFEGRGNRGGEGVGEGEGEGRARIPHLWAPIAASLTVGMSLALPLFLVLREGKRAEGDR